MKPIKLTEKEMLKIVFQNPGTLDYYTKQVMARAIRDGKTEISTEEGFKYLEESIRTKYKKYGLKVEN